MQINNCMLQCYNDSFQCRTLLHCAPGDGPNAPSAASVEKQHCVFQCTLIMHPHIQSTST